MIFKPQDVASLGVAIIIIYTSLFIWAEKLLTMHAEVAGVRNERKQFGWRVAEPACICCRIVPKRFFVFPRIIFVFSYFLLKDLQVLSAVTMMVQADAHLSILFIQAPVLLDCLLGLYFLFEDLIGSQLHHAQ